MALNTIFALSVLAFVQKVQSFGFDGPNPTATQDVLVAHLRGMSPKPTNPPLKPRNIFKRAIASADTCGWLWDPVSSSSSVLACDIGRTCAVYTSGTRMQGCCALGYSRCGFATRCYDYSQYQASSCGSSCQSNDLNLVCSNSASRYCQTYTWLGTLAAVGYGCEDRSRSTAITISTTSTGATFTTTAYLSIAPARAISTSSSYTTSRYSTYTSSAYRSGSTSSSSYYRYDSGLAVGAIVALVVIFLAIGLWYIAGLVIIICYYRRHKRFMTNVNNQKANPAAPVLFVDAPVGAVPSSTNIVSPMSSTSFPQQHGAGVPTTYYNDMQKGAQSPQAAAAYPASPSQGSQPTSPPLPQYSQQHASYTPQAAPAPYGTPPPTQAYPYPPQPYSPPQGQPQSPEGQPRAPVHVPAQPAGQQPAPANTVHEMG